MLVGTGRHSQGSLFPRNFLIQSPGLPHAHWAGAHFGPQHLKQELPATQILCIRAGPYLLSCHRGQQYKRSQGVTRP